MGVEAALRWDFRGLWVAGSLALLAAVAIWRYRALRPRTGPRTALLLAALRTAALALVLALIAGPRLVRTTFRKVRRPLAVAVDVSRSMGLKGGLERTRLERVQSFLEGDAFRAAVREYLPEYFAFSDGVGTVPPERIGSLAAVGPRTDIDGAVDGAAGQAAGDLAAVVVFTDGGHASAGAAAADRAAGVPVVFLGVGAGERTRDVEVAGALVPAVAFAGQPLQVRVEVRAAGFAGRQAPLLLTRGAQVLAARTVTLPADGETLPLVVEWTPPAPGLYPLTVQVPVEEGEQIAENNRRDISVEAVRDKIRVLFVTGSPTWNYRFLRGALKGDPSVDLVSFIILRSAADAVDVPQQDLSLIPFPTQKIFLEELRNFDLLIFDNFAYQPYLPAGYLERVEEFVRAGGGFWMLGGPLSFTGGRYQASALAPVLPVTLREPAPGAAGFREGAFQARLTPAGRRHPFFEGLPAGEESLPPLEGFNLTGPPREDAVVLAEVRRDGGAQPLVVIGRYGRGRVLAVLSDSLWRWAMEEVGRGRGNRAYLTFVRQALRWSIGDPQLQPVRVELERASVSPGERIRARVRVLGEDFLPAAAADLSVTLREPGGASRALAPVPESPGVFRVEGEASAEGGYEIAAEASARGVVYGRAAAGVGSAWPQEEFRSPGLNREALGALLSRRRGALLELGEPEETAAALTRALRELAPGVADTREETRPFAEMLAIFFLLLALLAAEWAIRRRGGLD